MADILFECIGRHLSVGRCIRIYTIKHLNVELWGSKEQHRLSRIKDLSVLRIVEALTTRQHHQRLQKQAKIVREGADGSKVAIMLLI
jgi:hypothetical protein